ncbi:hypothetical protein RDABS01_010695 [Bienertia sinuspersici]
MEFSAVKYISECYIKPKYEVEESEQPYHLSPFDLIFLSVHYNQKGLLFAKPNQETFNIHKLLQNLKDSLAETLVHFYPLAGQFDTTINEDQHRCLVYVDCKKGPGARFIHAKLDVTVSDITTPSHVPKVVKSFFDHQNGGEVVNHDGHSWPLLSIQVTELIDGIFIGCSMNHVLVDGTSFWHFWNIWSQIQQAINGDEQISVSRPPIHEE